MKYVILGDGGQYVEDNFTIVVMNVSGFGLLDNMVVLKKRSTVHYKLDIENKDAIVIVDRHTSFLSRNMGLVRIEEEDIDCEYLTYLSNHELDGSPKKEDIKYSNKKKADWFKLNSDKNEITEISNMYFDIFDILHNSENDLIGYLADNGIHTFKAAVVLIKEYLYKFGYRILFRNNEFLEWEMICGGVENFDKDGISDSIGKFWIIKDEERHFATRTRKPLTIYAEKLAIGYIIGNQGKNIKRMVSTFNSGSKYWEIPYIKVLPIEERITNNNVNELNDKCLKLLNKIFKEVKKDN